MAGSLCLSIRISNKLITFFLTLRPSGTVVSGQGAGWAWGGILTRLLYEMGARIFGPFS